jgi:CRP/FNR family transcriptional regulator
VEENLNGVLIPRGYFLNWVEKSEAFRTFTFHFFGERLIQLMALLDQLAFGRLNQRLASLLLANGDVIHWTHQKIAEDLGSAREVVSRALKGLESKGMVRLGRGVIHILDRSRLSNLAAGVDKTT